MILNLKLVSCSFIILLVTGFSSSLSAYSLGVYFNGGIGESWVKRYYLYSPPPSYYDFYFKGLNYVYGGGLVFDTCDAQKALFNNRLQAGLDELRYPKAPDLILAQYNYKPGVSHSHAFRISLKNTFCFAFVQNHAVRAWAGFSVSAFCYPNNLFSTNASIFVPRLFVPGIALGLNYHYGELLSFFIEGGLQYEWSATSARVDYMNSLLAYLSVGVLFNLRDTSGQTNLRLQGDRGHEKDILKEEVLKKENQKPDKDL